MLIDFGLRKSAINDDQDRFEPFGGYTYLVKTVCWRRGNMHMNIFRTRGAHVPKVLLDFRTLFLKGEIDHRALLGRASQKVLALRHVKGEIPRQRRFPHLGLGDQKGKAALG